MINVLWIITRIIPGGTRNILLWSLELLHKQAIQNGVSPFRFSVASGPDGVDEELKISLSKSGATLYNIPHLYRPVNPVNDWFAFMEIEKLLRSNNFQIVHTHTSKAGYIGRLAAKRAHIPAIVHTPHGHLFEDFFGGALGKLKTELAVILERQAAKWCDVIVALSQKEAKDYITLGIKPKKKIEIIPNALPSNLIPDEPLKNKQPGAVIGFMGRLVPEKGVADLLEAFSIVRKDAPQATMLIAGDGFLKDYLVAETDKKNIAKYVTFLGYNNNSTSFWNDIDIFVLPSHSEGFGLVLLEAMAHGKGVVATKVGGIPEIIEDKITGIIVRSKHPATLADAIMQCLNNPKKTLLMGKAAMRKIKNHFCLETNIPHLINLYNSLLTSG